MAKPTFATNDVPTAAQFNDWLVNVNFARRTGTQTVTNSTTLVSDNQLSVPVAANATYVTSLMLVYDSVTAADLKVLLRCPTGATFAGASFSFVVGMASQQDDQIAAFSENASIPWGGGGAAVILWGRIEGILVTAGTSGNASVEWAQNTANATGTNVRAGSFLDLRRVE